VNLNNQDLTPHASLAEKAVHKYAAPEENNGSAGPKLLNPNIPQVGKIFSPQA
jgi:hypothetical protein